MRTEEVQFFSDKEEEMADLLEQIGMKRTIARVLVFVLNVRETTSRDIERGTDLRQPEVSTGMRYLIDQGWVTSRDNNEAGKGRPVKIYSLAKSVDEIIGGIEARKKKETTTQIAAIKKIRGHI
jgi:predicted transcriptional regulator